LTYPVLTVLLLSSGLNAPGRRAKQVASGLEYLHSRTPPIVHRDVKPLNVLVFEELDRETPVLKLTDFGASREVGPGEVGNTRVGTPNYIAPEVNHSRPHDTQADVYRCTKQPDRQLNPAWPCMQGAVCSCRVPLYWNRVSRSTQRLRLTYFQHVCACARRCPADQRAASACCAW
jgi:serine/threonine protein kinase